ncbi:Phytochrome [Heracleum sosnowskyi]|uniref:Phytochrome n=1 Tax=Heracleum sosnowskyi TaxID=360622 RepID=A0AAD8JD94_9APIA|nr:Phytochrome [Heracleum sosnowskyi]
MSTSRPANSSTNSARATQNSRVVLTTMDAKLHAEYEETGSSFDYSSSVRDTTAENLSTRSNQLTNAYLHQIQKGKFIQSFGCLLAVDEKSFKIMAYSENAPEMLTMVNHAVPTVGEHPVLEIETDVRTIFTVPSAVALQKAVGFADINLLNPILVHCKSSGKPYYAIAHRVTGSLIIDFEPVKPYEVPITAAGALQSYKLASKSVNRLQALSGGSIVSQSPNMMDLVKCDGAALLFKNTVYRLGATLRDYQLRDIVSWLTEYHMDSTGLSTDSLYDAGFPGALALGDVVCGMAVVKITSHDMLFWFRSPAAGHIRWGGAMHDPNEKDDGRKMHPRSSFKAFLEVVKTRSATWKDFEMDAIHSLQLILRKALNDEKAIVPEGYESRNNTSAIHAKLNDLNIDGIQELEAVTSEMVRLIETATVPIFAVDADQIVNGWNTKIGELTGLPVDKAIGKHLLTLVEDSSIDTVEKMLALALQGKEEQGIQFEFKTHGSRGDAGSISLVVNACANKGLHDNVVGVCFVAQDVTDQKTIMDKFTRVEGDYKAIVHNPNPLIPPIFGTDEFGWCFEWNQAMSELSGWHREEVIDKMLLGEIFGVQASCCRLKSKEAFVNLGVALNNAMTGQISENIRFGFFARDGKYVECLLCASKKLDGYGTVTGIFCFLQLASQELQQALHIQHLAEQTAVKRLKVLAYLRRQAKNPLAGINFIRKKLEEANLGEEQKKLLRTSGHCQLQLNKILDDTDLDSIIDGYLDLEMSEFMLQDVYIASRSQVIMKSSEKAIQILDKFSKEIMSETLYGDSLRLQQVLSDFLMICVNFTPVGGQLGISATSTKDNLGQSVQLVRLEFRITHAGAVPEDLLSQMFGSNSETSDEGVSLLISRKLVKLMNGDVHYLREAGKSTFIISVELAGVGKRRVPNRYGRNEPRI